MSMQADIVIIPKPPTGSIHQGDREAVRLIVAYLWEIMWERDWPGSRGLSAWSAYKALLWLAWRHGALSNHWIELVATRAVNGELEAEERDKARHQAQREHCQQLSKTGKIKGRLNRSPAGSP
jgi:hypothetical protein